MQLYLEANAMIDSKIIEEIRRSSRMMVRELGFMKATLATTDYSASAVHTLLELENNGTMNAAQLAQILGLEKSSISRMLSKLVEGGELIELQAEKDGRSKSLQLTSKGQDTVNKINAYAEMQVVQALKGLDYTQQEVIAQGLTCYAAALTSCHDDQFAEIKKAIEIKKARETNKTIEIVSGYHPGMIGRITELHANYYSKHYGFGHFFEAKVASGLAEFSERLQEKSNNIWLAIQNNQIVGSVAIDGQDLGSNEAHLRWFILDDACRGHGIGKKLLTEAMAFCDQENFSAVQLWTFSGLEAARRLYESYGFKLSREWEGDQWGKAMLEQQFTR